MQCIVLCIVLRHFLLCFKSEVETRPEGNLRSWAQWELLRCPVFPWCPVLLGTRGAFAELWAHWNIWGCLGLCFSQFALQLLSWFCSFRRQNLLKPGLLQMNRVNTVAQEVSTIRNNVDVIIIMIIIIHNNNIIITIIIVIIIIVIIKTIMVIKTII